MASLSLLEFQIRRCLISGSETGAQPTTLGFNLSPHGRSEIYAPDMQARPRKVK